MNSMRRFVQSEILLILLTLISIKTSPVPYVSILFASMLMILFNIKSLHEKANVGVILIQILLSMSFAISAAGFLSFLIFNEFYLAKRKWSKALFPPVAYAVTVIAGQAIVGREIVRPLLVFYAMVLLVLSGVLFGVEHLVEQYAMAKIQMDKAVRVSAVNEMVERKLNQELMQKNYLSEQNARLEERENISRNIHNSVGHSITAAIMTLDAADMLYDTAPEQAREKMNTANARMREGLTAIRHAVRVLDTANECLVMEDLIKNFTTVIEPIYMDNTIRILTAWQHLDRTISISRAHTEFLTGALQELLTNGIKHGNADRFTVAVDADSRHVRMRVCDNGRTDFSAENQEERIRNGFGLKKIAAYARRCGGGIVIANDRGFCVEITLPLNEEKAQ